MTGPDSGQRRLGAAIYSLLTGLAGLGALGYVLVAYRPPLPWLDVLTFALLSVLVQRSSFHLGTPMTHSLSGVVDVAAILALGMGGGAAVAALGGLAYLELRAIRHRRYTTSDLVLLPIFNGGLKALMALIGGSLLGLLASGNAADPIWRLTLPADQWRDWLALGALCLAWFLLDHVGWGILDYLQGGWDRLRRWAQGAAPEPLLVELLPLPLGAVLALGYERFPWPAFALMALSIVAASLLVQRWADSRAELMQRVTELLTLEQVASAIAKAQFDIDELCQLLYEHASRVADTTFFHLGLFQGDDYVIKLWIQSGNREPGRTFRLSPGVGLVNWLRESRQPLLVNDFERERDTLPARPAYVAENPPRSALFVPLMAGETVIGTLSAQSYTRNAYSQSELRVLSAMANQAAVAIQKAQLFEQERKRARQLETIGRVARQVSATLKLEELFRDTVRLIRESFGYYHVAIFTVDREQQTVAFQASSSAGERNVAFDVRWDEGLIGWVAANAQSIIANDVQQESRYRCVDALEETQSEMAVPLRIEAELVGVLDVQSDRTNAFSDDDLFILETLGAQIAIAIQKARLYEAEQRQAWLSTALLQVSDAFSHLSHMDEVLTTLVRLTAILAGVDRCAILLWDQAAERYLPAETYGLSAELRHRFERTSLPRGSVPVLDLVASERSPVLVDATQHRELLPTDLAEAFQISEMAALPLVAHGDLLGAMLVDYARAGRSFTEHVMALLTGIANQAATVIQSARLLETQKEEAYLSIALLQVADAVSHSTELSEALASVVRITPMLVGVEACGILLWDADAEQFVASHHYGLPPEAEALFEGLRLTRSQPPASDLAAGLPYTALPESHPLAASLGAPTAGAVLVLPVAVRGELVGLLAVHYSGPGERPNERQLGILSGIAGQVAIAVENSRLLQEAAEQVRMKQELEVARRIQASFLPERCPEVPGWDLAAIWRSAREVAGDFYDFIPILPSSGLPAATTGVVIADVADKGVPAALFMALSRTLLRTMAIAGRPPAEAVAQANDLILADTRSELFVTLFYTILKGDSGTIAFVNAGHLPPLLVRAADGRVEELRTGGMAMGVLPGVAYQEGTATLAAHDALILYTDGIVEATNPEGLMFGRDRLKEVTRAHRSEPAERLAERISDAVARFVGDAAQSDDMTLVVVKRQG